MGTARVSVPVKFGFLDLPPELRVKIYRSLFIVDKFRFGGLHRLTVRMRDGMRRRVSTRNNAASQLLRTCRLVLHEGLPMLWGENIFAFISVNDLNHWMCGWPLDNKGLIRSVVLEPRYSQQLKGMNRALAHFISLGNLRKFNIDVRDVFLDLEEMIARITRCKGFLKKLFRHSPAIECGVIVVIEQIRKGEKIDGQVKIEGGEVRYKFVPNGKVQSKQTFSLAFDPSWPAENYEHLVGKFEGFLDLPPELRLKIYRNLFILENVKPLHEPHDRVNLEMQLYSWQAMTDAMRRRKVANPTTAAKSPGTFANPNAASPQLLMTCKLCLHEGLPVLYGENEIVFDECSEMRYYLDLWSPKAKASVKIIIFKGVLLKRSGLSAVARCLNALTSLRKFEFQPESRCYLRPLMSLDSEGWEWLTQRMNRNHYPGKTFLNALYGRNPSATCRVVQDVLTWNASNEKRGVIRYNVIPHGNVKKKRTFTLELDTTWPVKKYEALLNKS
ncbi:hypothetical protein EG327_001296 [Venturia inaequalis]|uniref:F-box domain-containing protein n=1 Tax=Venturia inaequalis TaxID=5025 RepID=A0A8H3VN91_VENIN|nr:hypothetical protein EG327_001296 [Venturia inaequalis]